MAPQNINNSLDKAGSKLFSMNELNNKGNIGQMVLAILFIIFDLEVTFLFPWAVVLNKVGLFGFWSMMVFLAILTIGFVYEWRKGALDWS